MQRGKINLNLLNALYYLTEEQSVSLAAEKMHLSQSAMSKHLAKLRHVFADPLLVRAEGKWQCTERALSLKNQVAPLLDSVESLLHQQHFEPALCQRNFTIATSDYVSEYILPKVLGELYQQAPQLKIQLVNWDTHSPQQLGSGEIDFGMTLPPTDSSELHASDLGQDNLVCLMHQQHPYLQLSEPTANDYCRFSHAVVTSGADKFSNIERQLKQQGLKRQVQLHCSSYPACVQILAETKLILTLPQQIAKQLMQNKPLALSKLPFAAEGFAYSLIWHHRQHHDPAHQWFRQQLLNRL